MKKDRENAKKNVKDREKNTKNRKVRVSLGETTGIFGVLDQKVRLLEETINNRIKVRRLIGKSFMEMWEFNRDLGCSWKRKQFKTNFWKENKGKLKIEMGKET